MGLAALGVAGCGGGSSPVLEQPSPQPPSRPSPPDPIEEPPAPDDGPIPSPDPESPPPQPEPEPEPTPQTIRIQVNFQGESRSINLPPRTSVLEAIKETYNYQREANINDWQVPSEINGVTGPFRYLVNNEEPRIHAASYSLDRDSLVVLSAL